MNWKEIIGKKIIGFRGIKEINKYTEKTKVPLSYILFDDKETYIELSEQDKYEYHDCSPYARCIKLRKNDKFWLRLFNCDGFAESNEGLD